MGYIQVESYMRTTPNMQWEMSFPRKRVEIANGDTVLQGLQKAYLQEKQVDPGVLSNELSNCTILLNGRVVSLQAQVKEGDTIIVLPLIGGG